MLTKIRELLIGSPLPSYRATQERLNKIRALAAFSPDALSSIAYANQEIYLGLLVAGSFGLRLAFPIGLAISILLVIVAISYLQTIHAYPSGGGSYVVARENLGTLPGLVAAAALMIDYILTAAVSLTAGVEAIASAFPALWAYRVIICLGLLVVLTLLNLRGLRETGSLMSIPVYLFLFTYFPMLIFGLIKLITHGPVSLTEVAPPAQAPLTLWLILHTFSAGSTALTGIESISNGVPAFQPPESKNAARTLGVMAVLMAILFVGSIGLTQAFAIIAGKDETILSALARYLFGGGPIYFVIQTTTLLILTVAANTSFAGFPRVAAFLAKDGFLPRQLTGLGDRLVFANGIILLSLATAALIILFNGNSHFLIPLFAVGAFLAFTLSQSGMVLHWFRERGRHWHAKALANALGATATGTTLIVVAISKFTQGAWLTVLIIPLLVLLFLNINLHYRGVAKQLSMQGLPPSLKPLGPQRIIVPVSGVHRGVVEAVNFARAISSQVRAVYIELEPEEGEDVQKKWREWWPDIPLDIVPSPFRSTIGPLLDYLDKLDEDANDGQTTTIVLPEFIPAHWYQYFLHNQTALLIKAALLYRRREHGFQHVIIDVPFHLQR